MWGWVMGFPAGRGWNGCLSLPRILSLSSDGELVQKPASQLKQLRGEPVSRKNLSLANRSETLKLPTTNTLELLAEIDLKSTGSVSLKFSSTDSGAHPFTIGLDKSQLSAGDVHVPLDLSQTHNKLKLHIFVDGSVMEIFTNDLACATILLPAAGVNSTLELTAAGGEAEFKQFDVWPVKTIW